MTPWATALIVSAVPIGILLLSLLLFGPIYRALTRKCPENVRLDGKTVVVTGASAGLGKATALELAKRGARVIMGCRNLTKAQPVAEDIISKSGNTNVVVRHLELSDFASVRKFAAQINAEEEALHILINNAGIAGTKNKEVASCGHELVLATNHYGHFLLTHLLMGKLKAGTSSRVINVSSALHADGQLDVDDLNFDRRRYRFEHAYSQSKLANVLFTKELARRLKGSGVVTNVLHPGTVNTEVLRRPNQALSVYMFGRFISPIIFRTETQGAQTQLYLALSEEGGCESGCYYVNCRKTRSSSESYDSDLAKKLWEVSCKNVYLEPAEMIPDSRLDSNSSENPRDASQRRRIGHSDFT